MSYLAPAASGPAHTLPANAQEAQDQTRPLLVAGGQPGAVAVLIDIEAQGVATP